MTKEKFEAIDVPPGPLGTIKVMCQTSEYDCSEAEMRSKDKPELASYYRGRASAFNSVLSFIRELDRNPNADLLEACEAALQQTYSGLPLAKVLAQAIKKAKEV